MLLSLLHGGITYMLEINIYVKHEFLQTFHNSVTINLSPLRREGACQLFTGSLEFFCTHDTKTRSMAGKEKMKRSIQRGGGGGGVVNMGVIEGHGERDGGRRAASFWLLSKDSVAPCEQTKILVS